MGYRVVWKKKVQTQIDRCPLFIQEKFGRRKKWLISGVLFLVLFCLQSCATVTYLDVATVEPKQEIITVENATADQLFVKASSWAVEAFNDSKAVIELQDERFHIIKGKFTSRYKSGSFGWTVEATSLLTIEAKDGRSRISIKLIGAEQYNGNGAPAGKAMTFYFGRAQLQMLQDSWNNMVASYESALKASTAESNW